MTVFYSFLVLTTLRGDDDTLILIIILSVGLKTIRLHRFRLAREEKWDFFGSNTLQ